FDALGPQGPLADFASKNPGLAPGALLIASLNLRTPTSQIFRSQILRCEGRAGCVQWQLIRHVMKSNRSREFVAPSPLKSALPAKKSLMKAKKSMELMAPSWFQSQLHVPQFASAQATWSPA